MSLRIAVLFCKTEVDNVNLVSTFPDAHEKVIGLDITVDERLGMDVLNTRDLAIQVRRWSRME